MVSKPDISVKFCNLELENPYLLSSAPPTCTGEMIMRAFEAGWAGAVTKTIKPDKTPVYDLKNRFGVMGFENKQMIIFENIEEVSKRPVGTWVNEIKEIKKKFPEKALIGSIMAECKEEDWEELARVVSEAGVDMLELNFGCPHGMPERGMGAFIGQRTELIQKLTKAAKRGSSVPVMVKLTPNVTDIAYTAKAAEEAGADAISAINTVLGLIGINIDTFEPMPTVDGMSTFGGLSGPGVKPIGLRCVAQIAQATNIPVSGIGGITTWKDAVEYLLVGAGSVQVCTAVMWRGYRIISDFVDGLTNYLADKGFSSVRDIIGKSLPKLTAWSKLNKDYTVVANINKDLCIKCGLCYVACLDAGYQAIKFEQGKSAEVDEEKCDACSLCTHLCPVPGCITWKKVAKQVSV
ncbi:MAG: NAD-dependent dihydropyrimidine dehydrogenase subunit PreA [Candidatus Methanomethyliaceae archaeon]|nr:NAD-dependent dihydropyrimidine dehydrogenase subunit PreA [Candidatus Methanomethyliaceae archaeon]